MSISSYVDNQDVIHFHQDGKDILTMIEIPDEKTGRTRIAVCGKLNHVTVPGFCDELSALISVREKITLDMAKLTYIDPGGISALVRLQQQIEQMDPESYLLLVSVPETIDCSLKAVGASDLLVIE